jgi:hypothetical protein
MDGLPREGEHCGLGSRGVDGKAARVAVLERERKNQRAGKIMSQRDKPRTGSVASASKLYRNGVSLLANSFGVVLIDWLDAFIRHSFIE